MQIVMCKITIQFVYVNQVTQEIHNLVASNWSVNQTAIVPMTKHASTMNVSIHVCFRIRVRSMQNVSVIIIKQPVDACLAIKEVHLIDANVPNVAQISIVQVIVLASIIIA